MRNSLQLLLPVQGQRKVTPCSLMTYVYVYSWRAFSNLLVNIDVEFDDIYVYGLYSWSTFGNLLVNLIECLCKQLFPVCASNWINDRARRRAGWDCGGIVQFLQETVLPPPTDAAIHMQERPPHKRFLVGCSSPFMRFAETPDVSIRPWGKQLMSAWTVKLDVLCPDVVYGDTRVKVVRPRPCMT